MIYHVVRMLNDEGFSVWRSVGETKEHWEGSWVEHPFADFKQDVDMAVSIEACEDVKSLPEDAQMLLGVYALTHDKTPATVILVLNGLLTLVALAGALGLAVAFIYIGFKVQ